VGVYYFGPLGRLLPMDLPLDGFDDTLEEVSAVHQSLSGVGTKDVFGHKRKFTIPLEGLAPRALSWFEMAYRGALGQPLYLMDEARVNRLGAAVSSTLSAWSPYVVLAPSTGAAVASAATVEKLPAVSPDLLSLAPAMAVTWTTTAGGVLVCQPKTYTPVLPGETVCFSSFVTSGTPTLELVPFAKGTLAAGAAITGTVTVAGAPPRRYVSYTVPVDGSVVAVRPQVRVAAAGTAVLLGMQLERRATPSPWVIGSGVPKVMVTAMPTHRRRVGGYQDGSITLQEV
jgi:hypothetical protein